MSPRYPRWVDCLVCGEEYVLGSAGTTLHTCAEHPAPRHRRNVPADSLPITAFSAIPMWRGGRHALS